PDQLDDVYNQIEGSFVGLGIELKSTDKSLLIVKVIPNGPAHRAGIVAGDKITAVNGKPTSDVSTDKAADMLKGEQGTYVDVTVLRGDSLRSLQVRRERVDVPGVEDIGIIDQQNKIGYFRLTSFQKTTSRDVDRALWQLHREGMRSLIVDVRGNPGGLLPASVEVADKFVQEGTLVSTRGRSPREDFDYKAHRVGTWRVPLIVLIDRDTASASEIFAGAIHDHNRGTIVGERSYGKGSVQGIFPLSISRAGVRLTTAKFYSPSGQAISEQGVKPHRTVHVMAKPVANQVQPAGVPTEQSDPVVAAACEAARQLTVAAK
ncbi:MAG: S41 family peptidase, partial [Planctomycetota bacterium]